MKINGLDKSSKLKSKKQIEKLFLEGKQVQKFPLKMIYLAVEEDRKPLMKAAFAVPKRKVRLATRRNRIKRLLRESYRLQQYTYFNKITTSYDVLFLYLGNEKTTYQKLAPKMERLLQLFVEKVSK
ncbi:MAG: ribonuclease P protein component [Flavobacteriaceae bacterium]|nr:ribonuclease P protein component [Flavobacteriaceae bacterium]